MQDNQRDEQFVDHGWREMRKLLDREMPLRPWWRRRRAGWLALLLLLGFGLGGGYFLGWGTLPDTTAPAPMEEPVAATSDKPEEKPGETAPEAMKDNSAGLREGRASDQEVASPAAGTASRIPAGVAINNGDNDGPADKEEATPGPVEERDAAPQLLEAPLPSIAVKEAEAAEIALLPTRQPAIDLKNAFLPLPGGVKVRPVRSFFLIPDEFGLRASGLASREGLGSGLAVGITAGYRLGSARWILRTGLDYHYQQRDFYRPGSGMNFADEVAAPAQPEREHDDLGTSQAALPPGGSLGARTHRLSVPVTIGFRIGRRWELSTGATAGYILSAKQKHYEQSQQPSFQFAGGLDRNTFDLLTTAVNQPIPEELLRNWEFGLTGGLSFRPHRRFVLQLEYHHGLTDLVRSDYYASYNRYLGLGAAYLLR